MIPDTPKQREKALTFSRFHAVLILYNMAKSQDQ